MYKNNKKNKAISLLSSLLKRPISETYKLEDKDQHAIAKQQLREGNEISVGFILVLNVALSQKLVPVLE